MITVVKTECFKDWHYRQNCALKLASIIGVSYYLQNRGFGLMSSIKIS